MTDWANPPGSGQHPPGIIQRALPPYEMRCMVCGTTWEPTPGKGQEEVSSSRLDQEAARHWKTCAGPSQ